MTIEEIRLSGRLESYILGNLSGAELIQLEQDLLEFPELKVDLKQIERAFRAYGELNGIKPPDALKQKVIRSISTSTYPPVAKPPSKGFGPFFLPALLLMTLLGISWYWGNKQKQNTEKLSIEYLAYQQKCDSIATRIIALQDIITNISSGDNRPLKITPTEAFASVNLILHLNQTARSNYIQATSLPTLSVDQAFQLWSLKPGQDPIPLTVFSGLENEIFEVDFEGGTGTYAITIEPVGGSLSPNLDQLIGTIQV